MSTIATSLETTLTTTKEDKRNDTSEATSAKRHRENDGKKPVGKRNKELGRRGEEAAARFLYKQGYDILERNWSCFAGEADIIARDDNTLVFIEVKTRKSFEKGFPSEAVTTAKRDRYEKIALAYVADYSSVDIPVRFDVISIVVVGPGKAMIRHDINAFSVV